MTLGYIIPAIALSLPAPTFWSYDTQQLAMAAWQVFPIWVSLFQQLFKRLLPQAQGSATEKKSAARFSLRVIYAFSILSAGATQVATLALSLTAQLFPMLFVSDVANAFEPRKVLLPTAITGATKMGNVADGVKLFLQYDEICGSAAFMLFTAILLSKKWTPKSAEGWLSYVSALLVGTVLVGPGATAAAGLWIRDEIVWIEDTKAVTETKK